MLERESLALDEMYLFCKEYGVDGTSDHKSHHSSYHSFVKRQSELEYQSFNCLDAGIQNIFNMSKPIIKISSL